MDILHGQNIILCWNVLHWILLICTHHFTCSESCKLKRFVGWHQPTQCCSQEWQWGAGSLDYWWMWHYPCCQEGKAVIAVSNIPLAKCLQLALVPCTEYGNRPLCSSMLRQNWSLWPACSEIQSLTRPMEAGKYTILSLTFVKYLWSINCILAIVPMLSSHRIDPKVLSLRQPPGATLQWCTISFRSTTVTGESWARCFTRS